ncbi:MAG: rod shape-determining protein RodA [Candidatus Pacebacteria bacterium]|nr:rod shape-determining protein RodA [Candidatus Paceibacterota bacterium]
MIKRFAHIDWTIILTILPIFGAGLLSMRSLTGENNFFEKQIVWILLSLIVFFIASQVDFRFFKRSTILVNIYLGLCAVLVFLFFAGSTVKGSQSWFQLAGFSFQPADFVKVALILMLAKYFSRRHVAIGEWRHVTISAIYMFIPFVLILLQPDFGSAMVIFFIWFGMVLFSGLGRKQILILTSIGVVVFASFWLFVFKPYQKARIANFVNPSADIRGTGYNVFQSIVAVGSGQVIGKGIGYGTQSRLQYLPEHETDFIFAAFSEEWGFIGALLLLGLYVFLFYRIISIALVGSSNFESLYAVGFAIYLMSHLVVNVGMNIGLMPVTGIPLPFMSYGGSHILAEMFGLGLLVSTKKYARVTHREMSYNELIGGM